MKRASFRLSVLLAALGWTLSTLAADSLRMVFIDVEGGQATLIVAPNGESLLVDAGWPGFEGRDAERIARAAQSLGLHQIDYMLVTHYHLDHVGGVPPLLERIPLRRFIDHGDNTETGERAEQLAKPYYELRAKAEHMVVKPGDQIRLGPVTLDIVAARGEVLSRPLAGAGQANPRCREVPHQPDDPTENAKSIGFRLSFGKFRFLDLADLTWNLEQRLACPENKLGTVDVYLVTHHGSALSNNPALVHAVQPRVAIMNNGARKGGDAAAWQVVRTSPGLEDLWQLHYALKAGEAANVPESFIANPEAECKGYNIRLEAWPEGRFTVTNERNQFSKTYAPRTR